MLLSHNLDLSILLLPDGDDPDSFARKHTPEEFQQYIKENEQDFIGFKTKVLLDEASGNPTKRTEAVKSIIQSLSAISDKTKRAVYIRECSRQLEISEEILAAETARLREQIVNGIKREREHNRLPSVLRKDDVAAIQNVSDNRDKRSADRYTPHTDRMLDALERKVLSYCVKYGMKECADFISDVKSDEPMTVVGLVKAEMDVDGIEFGNPVYNKIFQQIIRLIPVYKDELQHKVKELESKAAETRKRKYQEIADKNLDLAGIEKEEHLAEEEISAMTDNSLAEFSVDFVSRILASHEDDEIRKAVLEMITVKYRLSKYHTKYTRVETEEDRLGDLIFRALNEWKQGILQTRLSALISDLTKAQEDGDDKRTCELQLQIFEYEKLRRQFASSTGDRVILPKI